MRSEQSAVSSSCGFSGPTGIPEAKVQTQTLHQPNTEKLDAQLLLTADCLPTNEKTCPLCSPDQPLPLSEFGICRARPDGKNLYCKACIRKKVSDSRREVKEYRAVQKRRQLNLLEGGDHEVEAPSIIGRASCSRTLAPVERVKLAIERGARTQRAIAVATRLSKDAVCDAIAELLLWTREIKTEVVDNIRTYSISTKKAAVIELPTVVLGSARKPDVRSGFASITQPMPRSAGERKVG